MKNIAHEGIRAVKWSVFTTMGRFLLQLIAQVVLARSLGPDVYGVFGMALVVFGLCNFLALFGFAYGINQLPEITEEDIRFAFTWQMVAGFAAFTIMLVAAPWMGKYFQDTRVVPIIRWMSVACLLSSANSVSAALMQRRLQFRQSGLIQLSGYALGYIVLGVPLALFGGGVYTLVAAWITQASYVLVVSYFRQPHSARPLFSFKGRNSLARIGTAVFFTNIGNWLLNNLDRLIIGRFLDAFALGVYNIGFNLANMPSSLIVGALQPVFLSAGARVQGDVVKLRNVYRQISASIWVLIMPVFVLLAFLAPDIVKLLYGAAWAKSAIVLEILFLAMPALITWGMATPVLWNRGKAKYELLLQLPIVPLAVVGYFMFARYGIAQAASISAAILGVRGLVMATAASRLLGLAGSPWVGWIVRGIVLSILTIALPVICRPWIPAHWPVIVPLLIDTLLGLASLAALVLLIPKIVGADARGMVVRFAPSLKARMQ